MRPLSLLVLVVLALAGITGTTDAAGLLDATDTTSQWQVQSEDNSVTKLSTVPVGEKQSLHLAYQMNNSDWVALLRKVPFSLEDDEALEFEYQTTGSVLNFSTKVVDRKGNVFGFSMPQGSSPQTWRTVAIPRKYLSHFFGGDGKIDWSSLTGIEFALHTGPTAGDYVVAKDKPGTLGISNIRVVRSADLSVPGNLMAKTSGQKQKTGGYMIDAMRQVGKWIAVSDADGSCSLSKTAVSEKKGPSRDALKVAYNFGRDGTWVAAFKKVNLDLSAMHRLKFKLKGAGGANALVVKLKDSTNRVFGYTVPSTTVVAQWTDVVVPTAKLKYMFGGEGEAPISLGDIVQIEFAIVKVDPDNPAGTLFLSEFSYD